MTYYSRVQAHVLTKKIIIINAYLSCECDIEREKEKEKKKKGVSFWWLSDFDGYLNIFFPPEQYTLLMKNIFLTNPMMVSGER